MMWVWLSLVLPIVEWRGVVRMETTEPGLVHVDVGLIQLVPNNTPFSLGLQLSHTYHVMCGVPQAWCHLSCEHVSH